MQWEQRRPSADLSLHIPSYWVLALFEFSAGPLVFMVETEESRTRPETRACYVRLPDPERPLCL